MSSLHIVCKYPNESQCNLDNFFPPEINCKMGIIQSKNQANEYVIIYGTISCFSFSFASRYIYY